MKMLLTLLLFTTVHSFAQKTRCFDLAKTFNAKELTSVHLEEVIKEIIKIEPLAFEKRRNLERGELPKVDKILNELFPSSKFTRRMLVNRILKDAKTTKWEEATKKFNIDSSIKTTSFDFWSEDKIISLVKYLNDNEKVDILFRSSKSMSKEDEKFYLKTLETLFNRTLTLDNLKRKMKAFSGTNNVKEMLTYFGLKERHVSDKNDLNYQQIAKGLRLLELSLHEGFYQATAVRQYDQELNRKLSEALGVEYSSNTFHLYVMKKYDLQSWKDVLIKFGHLSSPVDVKLSNGVFWDRSKVLQIYRDLKKSEVFNFVQNATKIQKENNQIVDRIVKKHTSDYFSGKSFRRNALDITLSKNWKECLSKLERLDSLSYISKEKIYEFLTSLQDAGHYLTQNTVLNLNQKEFDRIFKNEISREDIADYIELHGGFDSFKKRFYDTTTRNYEKYSSTFLRSIATKLFEQHIFLDQNYIKENAKEIDKIFKDRYALEVDTLDFYSYVQNSKLITQLYEHQLSQFSEKDLKSFLDVYIVSREADSLNKIYRSKEFHQILNERYHGTLSVEAFFHLVKKYIPDYGEYVQGILDQSFTFNHEVAVKLYERLDKEMVPSRWTISRNWNRAKPIIAEVLGIELSQASFFRKIDRLSGGQDEVALFLGNKYSGVKNYSEYSAFLYDVSTIIGNENLSLFEQRKAVSSLYKKRFGVRPSDRVVIKAMKKAVSSKDSIITIARYMQAKKEEAISLLKENSQLFQFYFSKDLDKIKNLLIPIYDKEVLKDFSDYSFRVLFKEAFPNYYDRHKAMVSEKRGHLIKSLVEVSKKYDSFEERVHKGSALVSKFLEKETLPKDEFYSFLYKYAPAVREKFVLNSFKSLQIEEFRKALALDQELLTSRSLHESYLRGRELTANYLKDFSLESRVSILLEAVGANRGHYVAFGRFEKRELIKQKLNELLEQYKEDQIRLEELKEIRKQLNLYVGHKMSNSAFTSLLLEVAPVVHKNNVRIKNQVVIDQVKDQFLKRLEELRLPNKHENLSANWSSAKSVLEEIVGFEVKYYTINRLLNAVITPENRGYFSRATSRKYVLELLQEHFVHLFEETFVLNTPSENYALLGSTIKKITGRNRVHRFDIAYYVATLGLNPQDFALDEALVDIIILREVKPNHYDPEINYGYEYVDGQAQRVLVEYESEVDEVLFDSEHENVDDIVSYFGITDANWIKVIEAIVNHDKFDIMDIYRHYEGQISVDAITKTMQEMVKDDEFIGFIMDKYK
ncbi:hypothetical protein HBN50_04045 [Halobacteriovorax sp. GB3]|uniref:hypothetical protein n=1 Tax=Halobacteriovorax sp. GB3 TaxID=2719615 RepID=UPI00235F27EE|nr:hypothetical protein [Halobacteriovorax sp. GB3]MDD0852252.1 hypothetical protein [Halobacteriovorax sp. GB3]